MICFKRHKWQQSAAISNSAKKTKISVNKPESHLTLNLNYIFYISDTKHLRIVLNY